MTTATTTPSATSLEAARTTLANLQGALAQMPDRRDVLNTERALTAHDTRQRGLDLTIGRLRFALSTVPQLASERDTVATWIENLTTWREEFSQRLAVLPPGPDLTREEDHEQRSLLLSVKNIDHGTEIWNGRHAIGRALREKIVTTYPAEWGATGDPWESGCGSLPSASERLKSAEERLADAQHALDAAMVEAARLLS